MLQVAQITGIERANICRHVANLREQSKIAVAKDGYCPITRHRAGFLTTDPAKFPQPSQLNLFE